MPQKGGNGESVHNFHPSCLCGTLPCPPWYLRASYLFLGSPEDFLKNDILLTCPKPHKKPVAAREIELRLSDAPHVPCMRLLGGHRDFLELPKSQGSPLALSTCPSSSTGEEQPYQPHGHPCMMLLASWGLCLAMGLQEGILCPVSALH